MNTTEHALKERIKELTCLYEVTSIIVNANFDEIDIALLAIAHSLKKAFQNPEETVIYINTSTLELQTNSGDLSSKCINSIIRLFNNDYGSIKACYKTNSAFQDDFLTEEQLLLDNVALKIGNLLERIEITKNETALKRQMERADRLSILGEITAGIAHELNTPLANILGFAELLQSKMKKTDQIADLDKILNSAIYSREVVKKLMFFACEMPQHMQTVNIVPIIKDAVSLLDPNFRKKQVKHIIKLEDENLWLKGDTIQLTQIIFNLIINAIYYSNTDDIVTIEAFETQNHIKLIISDEGQGILEQDLDKVFEPFYTTKPVGEGSGLGLSVVHGIVTSHKGSIFVKSNSPKGTTFVVELPKL